MPLVQHFFRKLFSLGLLLGTFTAYHTCSADGAAFDVRPTPVRTPPPEYPYQLKRDGVSGVVAVKVEIDEKGVVTECIVTKSTNSGFNDSAVQAVKTWKFKPAQKDGAPVKAHMIIPIQFRLDE